MRLDQAQSLRVSRHAVTSDNVRNPPQKHTHAGNIRSIDAKGFKGIKPWPEVVKAQRFAAGMLAGRSKDLLVGVTSGNEQAAQAALESLRQSVDELGAAAEGQDRFAAVNAQVKALKALDRLGTLEVRGLWVHLWICLRS